MHQIERTPLPLEYFVFLHLVFLNILPTSPGLSTVVFLLWKAPIDVVPTVDGLLRTFSGLLPPPVSP